MANISFWDRITTIFEMIFSSTFFISLVIIIALTITILIVNSKVQSKLPKYLSILAYLIITVFVLIKYGSYVLSINDSIVEKFFNAMYFPNLVVYLAMLVITLLLLTITFINPKYTFVTKICNISCFCIIWFLFVLVLDVIKSEGINIYEITEVYANETLMILLQASMCVFFVWMGILIMNFAVRKISDKLDHKNETVIENAPMVNPYNVSATYETAYEYSNTNDDADADEEIKDYTDEEFQLGYINQQRIAEDNEIRDILQHKDIDF